MQRHDFYCTFSRKSRSLFELPVAKIVPWKIKQNGRFEVFLTFSSWKLYMLLSQEDKIILGLAHCNWKRLHFVVYLMQWKVFVRRLYFTESTFMLILLILSREERYLLWHFSDHFLSRFPIVKNMQWSIICTFYAVV